MPIKPKAKAVVLIILPILVIIIIVIILSFLMMFKKINEHRGELAGVPVGQTGSGGCWLMDQFFRNTTTITNAEDALTKLGPSYHPDKKLLQYLIDESIKAKVNPAVLISFWGAEQTFGNPRKALGYGCPTGKPCEEQYFGFENQVEGGLKAVNRAIEGSGVYATPAGENIWTRLLYHYVAADRITDYNTYGYVSPPGEKRIYFLKMLVPNEVICETIAEPNTNIASSTKCQNITITANNEIGYQGNEDEVKYNNYNGQQWCTYFVSWVYKEVGLLSSLEGSSPNLLNYFRKYQISGKINGDISKVIPGDIIWMTGQGSASGLHTGIAVEIKNSIVYTVEGNTNGNKVKKLPHNINKLWDFGRMKECNQ